MLEDFIIANMAETDDAQIIIRRSFFASSSCMIDVKRGEITFEVRGVMLHFILWKIKLFPPILSYMMYFPFLLRLRWRMNRVVLTLLIMIGFQLRILTMVMLKVSLLLLRHLA